MTKTERQLTSKKAAIIACKQLHPTWMPKQIAEQLTAEGISVTASQVSNALHYEKSMAKLALGHENGTARQNGNGHINRVALHFKKPKAQKRKKRPQGAVVALEAIAVAKQLTRLCSGTEAAHTLIDLLA